MLKYVPEIQWNSQAINCAACCLCHFCSSCINIGKSMLLLKETWKKCIVNGCTVVDFHTINKFKEQSEATPCDWNTRKLTSDVSSMACCKSLDWLRMLWATSACALIASATKFSLFVTNLWMTTSKAENVIQQKTLIVRSQGNYHRIWLGSLTNKTHAKLYVMFNQ